MLDVTLREATDADRDQIVPIIVAAYASIGEKFYPQQADWDLNQPATSYRDRGGQFVVLIENGQVIGTCATLPVDRDKGEATIRRMYLREDRRGMGHGRRLADWALSWMQKNGFTSCRLWTDIHFTGAHAFYSTIGFTKTGVQRTMHDCDEPYTEYEFTLQLAADDR